MNKLKKLKFIKEFTTLFPFRQGTAERDAGVFLCEVLKKNNIAFTLHSFSTAIPQFEKWYLVADGKKIHALPCSFTGGDIKDKSAIVSSLISSQLLLTTPNINFNPKCMAISLSNFYFAPSFAIHPRDLNKVVGARKVHGSIKVKKYAHSAFHILVGNRKNPATISFAHYDSIGPGAVDNASGVSILMSAIFSRPALLERHLFVLAANEELSYDFPVYWGHGFRAFEDAFLPILKKAKRIIAIDSVGHSTASIISDPSIIKLGFPIKNLTTFQKKIVFIAGDIDKLMPFYHSELDTYKNIKEHYLEQAEKLLLTQLRH